MDKKYAITDKEAAYFVLFATVGWVVKILFLKSLIIHNNPVEAGIVEKGEEYIYSSARDFYYG